MVSIYSCTFSRYSISLTTCTLEFRYPSFNGYYDLGNTTAPYGASAMDHVHVELESSPPVQLVLNYVKKAL
jgi:hypothetical protein